MRKINIELTKSATNLRTNTSIDNKDNVNNFKSADDKSGLNKTRIKNFKQKCLVVVKINFLTIIEKIITKNDLSVILSQNISYRHET